MVETSSFRPLSRRRTAIVAGVAVLAAAIGIASWTFASRDSAAFGPVGQHLAINVVAPVEPIPVEGGVLEVGLLNDGFDRAALDARREATNADYIPPDAYVGEDWPPLDPIRTESTVRPMPSMPVATVTTTDPLADGSRLFGFDRRPVATAVDGAAQNVAIRSEPAKNTQEFFE